MTAGASQKRNLFVFLVSPSRLGDYVGVVWGRDFIIRDGTWTVGNADYCYDGIDGLVSRTFPRRWCKDALELLRNRYRIFLTRGIEGTVLCIEDNETAEYFRELRDTLFSRK